jgi:hypothetical protein
MEHSVRFRELKSELMRTGITRTTKVELMSETIEVKKFSTDLTAKFEGSKELSQIDFSDVRGPKWSLLQNTAYSVGFKATQGPGLKKLCCRVIDEASNRVLESRGRLLQLPNAMDLRLSLWLRVNQWLSWNHSGLNGRFDYWDMLPDGISKERTLYLGEKEEEIDQLYSQDCKRLSELGDFLTNCPALCNNPDSPAKDRVVSVEVKEAIDALLEVRVLCRVAQTRAKGFFLFSQSARKRMDRQRLLTCPPDEDPDEKGNSYQEIPRYAYSQVSFKSFTDEEVRRQAGKEVLPPLAPQRPAQILDLSKFASEKTKPRRREPPSGWSHSQGEGATLRGIEGRSSSRLLATSHCNAETALERSRSIGPSQHRPPKESEGGADGDPKGLLTPKQSFLGSKGGGSRSQSRGARSQDEAEFP